MQIDKAIDIFISKWVMVRYGDDSLSLEKWCRKKEQERSIRSSQVNENLVCTSNESHIGIGHGGGDGEYTRLVNS